MNITVYKDGATARMFNRRVTTVAHDGSVDLWFRTFVKEYAGQSEYVVHRHNRGRVITGIKVSREGAVALMKCLAETLGYEL